MWVYDMTNDSKKILYALYKEYDQRRKNGLSRMNSKYFSSAKDIQQNFFSEWLLTDVEDCLRELSREKYLDNLYGDNTITECFISEHAIEKMENQVKETFLSVADFISKFIP